MEYQIHPVLEPVVRVVVSDSMNPNASHREIRAAAFHLAATMENELAMDDQDDGWVVEVTNNMVVIELMTKTDSERKKAVEFALNAIEEVRS